MRKYANKPVGELAAELMAGPVRLRRGYVDAAEELLRVIEPDRNYPYEFVLYSVTGYRPARQSPPTKQLPGESLRGDLQNLILDVCDSFELPSTAYDEPAYTTAVLVERFCVSAKTISRWRRRGLIARRLIFPDGKRRVGFLESSVQYFVAQRRSRIGRSSRFSKITRHQRAEIIRRAARMAGFCDCTLNEVARRIARKIGRSAEAVRYTIRRHDKQHPEAAIFPRVPEPLSLANKRAIYQSFLQGTPVSVLAARHARSRGSIYRIVREMRARQILDRPISYIYNPEFDAPDAEQRILGQAPQRPIKTRPHEHAVKPPPNLPPYLRALYDVPLLDAQEERDLFRRYNYLKHKAEQLRRRIDFSHILSGQLRQIETLLVRANAIKNQIIRANLRLVVSIAKRHVVSGPQTLFELISDGNISLMQAVEKFDYARGNRFSTYASWAIMRNFARSVPRERYILDRFSTGYDSILDLAASMRTYDPNEVNVSELRESIDAVLVQLTPRERMILIDHYGLSDNGQKKTFDQLGRRMGLSKERVRQIEIQALRKLRRMLNPQQADLMT